MPQEDIFFLPIRKHRRTGVVTCSPEDSVLKAAALMRERGISSLVVCEEGAPRGILTDRDLRNKVVSRGVDPRELQVGEIMNAPLITVDEEDYLYEALYRMSSHGIHRVVVVDAAGELTGILTDSDILRLQTRSPHQLVRQIEEAGSTEDLRELHERVQGLVEHLVGTGVGTAELVRLISHLNDRLLLRLIALLRSGAFADLPEDFAFVVLGSEGRQEQTLTTDQDNALIYADNLDEAAVARLEAFSRELIDRLIAIGVPPCPGGIMAKNEAWRRSLSGWTEVASAWLDTPTAENVLKASMFFDLRTLHGDSSLEANLKDRLAASLRRDSSLLNWMAVNVLRFKPPLGWFGRIKTERKGEHRGEIDVKKAGIFAITEGIKVLALEAEKFDGGTRERLAFLREKRVLGPEQAEDLAAAFDFLVHIRLRGQVEAVREGRKPSNYVPLRRLNHMEQGRLKLALEEVQTFQDFLKRHFRLEFVRA